MNRCMHGHVGELVDKWIDGCMDRLMDWWIN